jgi:ATP:ADP antiporter, AAA family
MSGPPSLLGSTGNLTRDERVAVRLLALWFFVITMTLWLLKPIRTAALLAHLGSEQLPWLRLGSAFAVGAVVLGYSRIVSRLSRLAVVIGANGVFFSLLALLWSALWLGGDELGKQRWFVWSVFCLVDMYAAVMVTIFWTYTNDVVSRARADRLYAPIGLGGILGGVAGGAAMDSLVRHIGPVHILLICAACVLFAAGLGWSTERILRPPPRAIAPRQQALLAETLEGAREVVQNRYLLWIVGTVVAYEAAAAFADFAVNVVFERTYHDELLLAQMYGRLGWIVSVTALASQLFIVPALLPAKRAALLVPPIVMALATVGLAILPVAALAIGLAASDRGLNYSLQQVTRETLYVPLGDMQRYKAKAFIDMFVDRAAKAIASIALVLVPLFTAHTPMTSLLFALASLLVWLRCAYALGEFYVQRLAAELAPKAAPALALDGDGVVPARAAASDPTVGGRAD